MNVLDRYPIWLMERIADPRLGIVPQCPEFPPSAGKIVAFAEPILAESIRLSDLAERVEARRNRLEDLRTEEQKQDELAQRKAAVIRELGYDPLRESGTKKTWCFDPDKPPADALWREPQALRESAQRIAREMAAEQDGLEER